MAGFIISLIFFGDSAGLSLIDRLHGGAEVMALWLKKYLTLFFDFEHFGNLNWLAFPILFYILISIRKRRRWEIALLFVFMLSCIFLSATGGDYPRYVLTLFPFALAAILAYGWEFTKKKKPVLKIGVFFICGAFAFLSFIGAKEYYGFLWRYKISPENQYYQLSRINYLNNTTDIDSEDMILVCSLRYLFYYHSNKKGVDFRDPRMNVIYRQETKEAALDILKNQIKIKYILLHWDINPEWPLNEIIASDCDLVIKERNGYLYRLREKELEKEELEELFINDSLLKNGSFENWDQGPFKKPDFFEGGDNVLEGMVKREEKEIKVGQYAARIKGDNFNFSQGLFDVDNLQGKSLTCFVWTKTNIPEKYRLQIYDGIHSSFSPRHSGKGNWELLQANHVVAPSAQTVTIRIIQAEKTGNTDDIVYVDGALLVEGDWNTFYLYRLHIIEKTYK